MSVRVTPDEDLHKALSAGGVVTLAGGVYRGSYECTADVTLKGEPGAILDAGGRGSVLLVQEDGLTVEVEGITLQGGHAELGAGVCLVARSHLTLRRCRISGNKAVQLPAGGAGVAAGTLVLDGCELSETDDVWVMQEGALVLSDTQVHGGLGVVDGATVRIDGGSVARLRLRASPRATPTVTVHGSAIAHVDNDTALPGNVIHA